MLACCNKHNCNSQALIQLSTAFQMYTGEEILIFSGEKGIRGIGNCTAIDCIWIGLYTSTTVVICIHSAQGKPEDKLLFFSSGMEIWFSLILSLQTNAEGIHKTRQNPLATFFFLVCFFSCLCSQAQQGPTWLTKQASKNSRRPTSHLPTVFHGLLDAQNSWHVWGFQPHCQQLFSVSWVWS